MKKMFDIQYNEFEDCKLDLFIPDKYDKAIVMIHGGGLVSGSKDEEWYRSLGLSMAEMGYYVSLINYRLLPKAKYPDFIEDVANAIKYVNNQIGNDVPLYVLGHSAGAYISCMLCVNKTYFNEVGISNERIAGWIIDSAQHTTHFHILSSKGLSEKIQRIDESATLYYIDENIKFNKMLLISYTNDIPCRLEQNELFFKCVKNCNNSIDIRLLVLDGEHCAALTKYDKDGKSILIDIIDNFVNEKNNI